MPRSHLFSTLKIYTYWKKIKVISQERVEFIGCRNLESSVDLIIDGLEYATVIKTFSINDDIEII